MHDLKFQCIQYLHYRHRHFHYPVAEAANHFVGESIVDYAPSSIQRLYKKKVIILHFGSLSTTLLQQNEQNSLK